MPRFLLAVGLSLTLLSIGSVAGAQPQSEKAQAAWKLEEGKRALAKGDLDAAIPALEAAHVILKQPTSGAPLARALAKQGRLADALGVARAVAAIPKAGPEAFSVTSARAEAEKLAADLDKRVPKLRIEAPETAAVTIDGRDVPAENGVRRVDPGDHVVEGRHEGKSAKADIKLAERDDKSVKLDFATGGAAVAAAGGAGDAAAASEGAGAAPAAPSKPPADTEESAGNPAAKTAAIVGFSVFAFGTSVGVGALLSSMSTLDDLDATCGGECTGRLAREENDAQNTRIVAFVGFGLAGAGLITGIVGAAMSGSSSSSESAVEPLVGPGYAGLRTRF